MKGSMVKSISTTNHLKLNHSLLLGTSLDEELLVHVDHCLMNVTSQGVNIVMCTFIVLSLYLQHT
uniref:Uncharacterized protein n=1 Tax=Lepeophtheirus salmonis TaxID=72036 RepID=A0A0K2TPI2_LEPSM